MKSNKNRVVLIVIIILLVLILGVGSVGAYLYLKTDLFKSNQQLFSKYIGQTLGELEDVIEVNKIEEISKKVNENSTESKIEMFLQSEELEDLEKNVLTITTQNDMQNKKLYNNIELVSGEESLVEFETMATQNSVSLRLTDVVKQFLTIENRDLEQVSENLEIGEVELQQILNILQYQEQSNILVITEQEKETLKNTYLNVILNNLTKENFAKQKDAIITVNGNTITTNAYTLTISPEQIKAILQVIVEQLKNDEIVLSKIEQLNQLKQGISTSDEENTLKQDYIEFLDEMLEEINNLENEEEIKFIVYEQEGKSVRLKIEKGNYTITMDSLVNDEMLGVNTKFVAVENNNEIKTEINLTKYKNENYDLSIELKSSENEDESIGFEIKAVDKENNVNLEMIASITIDGETVKAVLKNNIDIVEEITDMIIFDKSNNIILNDLTSEKCKQIIQLIGEATAQTYKEEIEAITQLVMLYMASDVIDNTNLSDIEISQFNSRFETYEGENISGAKVNALITMLLNSNLTQEDEEKKVSVTGDITLDINATSLPENRADTGKTYTIEMQYDESTGLINQIMITEN